MKCIYVCNVSESDLTTKDEILRCIKFLLLFPQQLLTQQNIKHQNCMLNITTMIILDVHIEKEYIYIYINIYSYLIKIKYRQRYRHIYIYIQEALDAPPVTSCQ